MKLLILGLIFASISYMGFQYGSKYKEKESFYNEFSKFLINLKSQINFLKLDLISIFKNYKTKDKNLTILLKNFENNLTEETTVNLTILNEDENLEISTFLKGLGKTDCLTQNDFIEKHIEIFNKKLKEKKELNIKYGNMYKKLGVLIAFLVCIVLI